MTWKTGDFQTKASNAGGSTRTDFDLRCSSMESWKQGSHPSLFLISTLAIIRGS